MDSEFLSACEAIGAERLRLAQEVKSQADWNALITPPAPFAFRYAQCWKTSVVYRVRDLASELGFYVGILGMPILAIGPDFAMLNCGDGYCIGLERTVEERETAPDSVAFEFMVEDILKTGEELVNRGASFEQALAPDGKDSPMYTGVLRTPHGIIVKLWGIQE